MTTIFKEEKMIQADTKCDKCWTRIFHGIPKARLNNGKLVIYCINCNQWDKVQSGEFANEQIRWKALNNDK